MTVGYQVVSKEGRVACKTGADMMIEIRIVTRTGQRAKASCSAIVQTVYQEGGQNGEDTRIEAVRVELDSDKAGTNGPGWKVLSERSVMPPTCIRVVIRWSVTGV